VPIIMNRAIFMKYLEDLRSCNEHSDITEFKTILICMLDDVSKLEKGNTINEFNKNYKPMG